MNNINCLTPSNTPVYHRRTKTEMACNECRRSKLKCDQTIPRTTCKRCQEKDINCEYAGGAGSPPRVSSSTSNTPTPSNQYNVTPIHMACTAPIPTGTMYPAETTRSNLYSVNQAEQIPAQTSQEGSTNKSGQLCYCTEDHLCIHHTNLNGMGEYMDILAYENLQNMPLAHQE